MSMANRQMNRPDWCQAIARGMRKAVEEGELHPDSVREVAARILAEVMHLSHSPNRAKNDFAKAIGQEFRRPGAK